MPSSLHILSFQNLLKKERKFLESLICRSIAKRRLILERASSKQLRLLQKLLTLFLRGDIAVTRHFFNRLKKSKKLTFIEENFRKIGSDPNLRRHILSLSSILHLFVKVLLKKKKK